MPRRRRADSNCADADLPPDKRRSDNDISVARGRFKGALMEALEFNVGDNESVDNSATKVKRNWSDSKYSRRDQEVTSDEEEDSYSDDIYKVKRKNYRSYKNNSYVMKLYDRSVDLAPFTENTPLYTICRAWMANKPRNMSSKDDRDQSKEDPIIDGIKLPPPVGSPVSRVPPLLQMQSPKSQHEIDKNLLDPTPSKDLLLKTHLERWHAVRKRWMEQSIVYETRYANTQTLLNEMSAE